MLAWYPCTAAGQEDVAGEEQAVSSTTATVPADPAVESSTGKAEGSPAEPTAPAGTVTTAISDLNYKIELMQSRYLQLNDDLENLRNADSAIRKMIAEDRLNRPDDKKFKSLEAQVEVLRTDTAQIREEMAALRTEIDQQKEPTSTEDRLRSPWISLTALAFSIIALLAM
jgi:molecular chaperone GrpE (heat shock protein)